MLFVQNSEFTSKIIMIISPASFCCTCFGGRPWGNNATLLKAGETGGARPIPRYLCRTRAGTLGLAHAARSFLCGSQNSFTCETPTPAAVQCRNKSPITTPGLTTLNSGLLLWCIAPAVVLHVWSAVAFWESCRWV